MEINGCSPSIETKKTKDKNKVNLISSIIKPGYRLQTKENEFIIQIRFTNLPGQCTISIFTVTGEFVHEFDHESSTSGNAWWDMRTVNNQEVAPGLYIYHVESNNGKEKIGKFAVIR